jgi:acetyl esterase/lipase
MKKLLLLIALPLFSITAFAQDDEAPATATEVKVVQMPAGFTSQLNVVYAKGSGWESKMDIYLPPKGDKPTAVIINIHGGGWNHGTKESQTGFSSFFKKGMAVANVEYRMTGEALAPAAVEDCRCALLYLIGNAKELNIDEDRIVVMGSSAGGHLALLTGLIGSDHTFDTNCPGVKKVKVAAIIDKYGLADAQFAVDGANNTTKDKSFIKWLGDHAKDSKFIASVSPITYVNKKSPPVFIVHGDADPRIPYQQSVMLNAALEKAGVDHQFMTVPGGLHGKFPDDQKKELSRNIMTFLIQHKIIQ